MTVEAPIVKPLRRVGMISLGCPKNLVDSEIMLGQLREESEVEITNDLDAASRINHIGWLVTLIILMIQFINFLVALLKRRSIVYTITNQRVMIEQGVLSKSLSEIDLRYIDETEFFQHFSERILGIGSVTLFSSDKAFPTTTLRGIKDPRAVRELIRSHAYQVSQRQLFTRAT